MSESILFNFSTKWNNKLECDYFTTLRVSDRHKVGDTGLITLKNQPLFIGEIIAKNELKLDAQPSPYLDLIAYLDTGYKWVDTVSIIKKMYSIENTTGKVFYQYLIRKTNKTIQEATLL
jgi:hypothetical protein